MGLSGVPPERLRAWVEASTRAQGLPVHVSDPATIQAVRALLAGGEPGTSALARSAGAGPGGHPSEAPDRLDPVDVQTLAPGPGGGLDHDVVDHGTEDGDLPVEVQVRPLTT